MGIIAFAEFYTVTPSANSHSLDAVVDNVERLANGVPTVDLAESYTQDILFG